MGAVGETRALGGAVGEGRRNLVRAEHSEANSDVFVVIGEEYREPAGGGPVRARTAMVEVFGDEAARAGR